jgi:hypothetical protein
MRTGTIDSLNVLQILGAQACDLPDSCEHPRAKLLVVVKREHDIGLHAA